MQTNLEKYKYDLEKLISKGNQLHNAILYEYYPEEVLKLSGEKAENIVKQLPDFHSEYQMWYSEALLLIKQLLPDRLTDFIRYYEKPKSRKEITFENYRIEDCLQGLNVTKGWEKEKIVGPEAAIPHFRQQLAIIKSVRKRFESSLFDIVQLLQADLFDSELDSSKELLKKGFVRGSGAMAGVVLEKHLFQVVKNHNLSLKKKNPTISDFNDLLKQSDVVDISKWRFIQRLGDLRNACDHNKEMEPEQEDILELIQGVEKITKTLY
jgi:hypothetical protein